MGTVVIVLSQFWILTVCRPISITSPSAPKFGISTQSPTRSMSLPAICMLATKPMIESLKTSRMIAVIAPRPVRSVVGDLPISVATETIPTPSHSTIFTTCE